MSINLTKVRIYKGLTQQQLATKVGVNMATISRIERIGRIKPRLLAKLAVALDTDADYLIRRGDEDEVVGAGVKDVREVEQEIDSTHNSWEVEKMLRDENRDKKKTAAGFFHMASKFKGRGPVKLYSDTLSTSQKKEYQKPSKVTTSNLSDKIKPLEEFIAYDDDLKRTLLGNWVLKFGVEGLCKAWKYDKATIASYCYKYGVKRQLKQAEKERTEKETNQINNQVKAQAAIKEVIYQAGIPVDVPFFDCTTILKIIDTLPGEEVYSYMQNISKFLIANKNYKISIDIKELITNE